MDLSKGRILMNAFFRSYFGYFPVIWMFHSRNLRNKIMRLRVRCFISFTLPKFEKDNFVSVRHVIIQTIVTEMYKGAKEIYLGIINEEFQSSNEFIISYVILFGQIRSVHEKISFTSKMWELIPPEKKRQKVIKLEAKQLVLLVMQGLFLGINF